MSLITELSRIGAIHKDRLELFYPRVRDRDDIAVLRDARTEVIVLSQTEHISHSYYQKRTEKEIYKGPPPQRLEDNIRRLSEFGSYIRNKRWLDFGCGLGGALDELAIEASFAVGLEPNKERASIARSKGHSVIDNLADLETGSLDIVTMFHVLEHLTEPLITLAKIRMYLKPGGLLLVEVPHSRDVLFTLFDCVPFKKFTFWSEHLVLHTRQSMALVLREAGFEQTEILGLQRYPLANHLYWLAEEKPGGHDVWRFLTNATLDAEYESILTHIDRTDSLIAISNAPV
jgi:2-polyprenyl-3-methyl-5-hydroxy-6-metoxy-1,4-benzoquinol methylase